MRAFLLGAVVATASIAHPARADEAQACMNAYEAGQRELKIDARFGEARAALTACTRPSCPPLVVRECVSLLAELDRQQPTIVVAARDEHGRDAADVRVMCDGVLITSHIDGRPVPLDPGEHLLRFELAGHEPVEQRLILHAGEKEREVHADFRPSPAPVTPSRQEGTRWLGIPTSAVVVAGIGVVSLGAWAALGLTGLARESHLSDTCGHRCNPSDVSALRLQYNLADVAMAAGFVALATAVVLVATHRGPAVDRAVVAVTF